MTEGDDRIDIEEQVHALLVLQTHLEAPLVEPLDAEVAALDVFYRVDIETLFNGHHDPACAAILGRVELRRGLLHD